MNCDVKGCWGKRTIGVRGKWLCDKHWFELCDVYEERGDLASESLLIRWAFPTRKAWKDAIR